jgi:Ca-activated chloride channel homolog
MKRLVLSSAIALALSLTACSTAPDATRDARQQSQLRDLDEVAADRVVLAEKEDELGRSEDIPIVLMEPAPEQKRELESVDVTGSRISAPKEARRADVRGAAGALAQQPMAAPESKPVPHARQDATAIVFESALPPPPPPPPMEEANREGYAALVDNQVIRVADNAVSTFSIDVDTGSYSNVRRMIEQGQLPPANAVRAEEMINYFDYGYQPPAAIETPFSVTTELAPAPWNPARVLMQIGIKGFEVPKAQTPPANLVFLIDTSGSMQSADKIELLKAAFKEMLPGLRARDRVSIVVYAGSAGLVLAPTPGDERERIAEALDQLAAGGSTNGAAGIELAYQMAQQNYMDGGINRVILATDGDFNVGTVSIDALKTLVADKRKSGIALTTLGFGQGNYQDVTAEQLADVGNGNHAYIDSLQEARKVLVEEVGSTLMTIAKDVKIQVEFNPAQVSEYRLIGYENRMLRREDFNNDRIDAGEIGAGHDVTAIYELTLVGSGAEASDPLRYGKAVAVPVDRSGELAWLKLRYKQPTSTVSTLIDKPIQRSQIKAEPSNRLAFAAAVAAYADLLRGGSHSAEFDYSDVIRLARRGLADDARGYRRGFVSLVERTAALSTPEPGPQISMEH